MGMQNLDFKVFSKNLKNKIGTFEFFCKINFKRKTLKYYFFETRFDSSSCHSAIAELLV